MNYRHAYHAGNFADVVKHAVLARLVVYMTRKPQPFRVIDIHAGTGCYDLSSIEATKTAEWQNGIGRLLTAAAALPEGSAALLGPYLDAVRSLNGDADLKLYPGSPLLARMLMRREDTLIANELHSEDCARLRETMHGKPNTKVMELDAWAALKSLLPPKERRGLILIDPPFEASDEFDRLAKGLEQALARFATGTYLVWYPVKQQRDVTTFLRRVRGFGAKAALNVSLSITRRSDVGLTETGLVIVNPPYVLESELNIILPALVTALAAGPGAGFTVEPLAG